MIYRILQVTDFLFVTFKNAGGDILKLFFLDEVGQATLPTVLVPITQFPPLKGLFWFRDSTQLKSTVVSMTANEVSRNSKMSPLEMVSLKTDCLLTVLNKQHRMFPKIFAIVAASTQATASIVRRR